MQIGKYLLVTIFIFSSKPAYAVLGEQIKAQSVLAKANFSISSTPGDRKNVKEFFDKSGTVFGTCYDPRIAKDLSQILGANYSDLFAKSIKGAVKSKSQSHQRIQVIRNNSLVIRSTRLGRNFSICVYDPQKLPEGVNENEIH